MRLRIVKPTTFRMGEDRYWKVLWWRPVDRRQHVSRQWMWTYALRKEHPFFERVWDMIVKLNKE